MYRSSSELYRQQWEYTYRWQMEMLLQNGTQNMLQKQLKFQMSDGFNKIRTVKLYFILFGIRIVTIFW